MMDWTYQSAAYLSALPGLIGPGMDVTAGDKPSKLYFITSKKDTKEGGPDPRGPNCFSGTARWCWGADQGENFHKFVVPDVGGYVNLGRVLLTPAGRGDMDYIGHAAPGAGLFFQTTVMNVNGGSNVRIWHMPSWMGDLPAAEGVTNMHAGNRDALQASADGYKAKNVAFINCEARFSMDEAVQFFYAMEGVSWIRGVIYDPLHAPPGFGDPSIPNHEPGTDHGYGHIVGGSDFVDLSYVAQSLYAHTTDRNPLMAANNHAHVNVLHYDHGRAHVAKGEGLNVSDNGGFNAAAGKSMQCNMVGSMSVRGPNNNDSLCFAKVTGSLPKGSSGHSAWNSQFGWGRVGSQDDFFTSKPSGYMKPTLRMSAWPEGLGSNYAGVLRPCVNPLHPRVQEGLDFVDLMRRTVGVMPNRRYLYGNNVNKLCDQISNAIRGVQAPSQYINTVADSGGWPVLPEYGDNRYAPFPVDAARDEIILSGPFAGLSRIREWIILQYHSTMGR